ncbi:MAG: hypothetical protein CMH54_10555 [Myxococcales bacterium]|nr:hypothetical protein [Myxococcales bacterium]
MKLPSFVQHTFDHEIPGRARIRYVFGSGLFFAMALQVLTGIVMAFYYVPSAREAYASVYSIQYEVTWGWLVRGLHHFGASAVVVLAGLHLLQVFLSGAYRKPREMSWITGVLMLGLIMGFALTGYLLPWDQKGYFATQVATNIAGGVPVVGEATQTLIQGGTEYGTATLTRFYALHVFALPLGLLVLIVPHLIYFFRHGVTAPGKDLVSGRSIKFWPVQAFYDLVFITVILGVLLTLAVFVGAPLDAPADPSSSYVARPEWYFLFLFQILKYFEGPMMLLGTVIIPGLAATYLVILPWLDRSKENTLKARWKTVAPMAFGLVALAALTLVAMSEDANNKSYQAQLAVQAEEAKVAKKYARNGFTAYGTIEALEGRKLFRTHCTSCHEAEGEGTPECIDGKCPSDFGLCDSQEQCYRAPVLDHLGSRKWFLDQIERPDHPTKFGTILDKAGNAIFKGEMPSYADPDDESNFMQPTVRAGVVEYLIQGTGRRYDPPIDTALAKKGEEDFGECAYCHEPTEGRTGPLLIDVVPGSRPQVMRLAGYGSDAFLRSVLNDPGHERLYGELNVMPSFSHLHYTQQDALIAYLRTLCTDCVDP